MVVFLACSATTSGISEITSAEIDFDYVTQRAQERAAHPYAAPHRNLPVYLRPEKLSAAEYRQIHFRHNRALWAGDHLPFRLEFFHPGYLFQDPVHLNEFTPGYVQPIGFVPDFFRYGGLRLPQQPPSDMGYAGFRILYRLNEPGKWDELGAFLGGSYFRLLGKGQRYGQSARGLALDCGETKRAEEFPLFTDWWIGKPLPNTTLLHAFALLDSVSCSGAYEFYINPGKTTVAEIQARIFLRESKEVQAVAPGKPPLRTLGLAPLTGMFWFGENSEWLFDDFRPEVHNCDGLLIRDKNDELIWRPLNNTPVVSHQKFTANNLKGFGLFQRDREFNNYQDLTNPYQALPSVWVKPHGAWGEGDVHLVELTTDGENVGNIVAFWSPSRIPPPGHPLQFGYTLSWTLDDEALSANRVVATRVGVDSNRPEWRDFVIDFDGPGLKALASGATPEVAASCTGNGRLAGSQILPLPQLQGWRVILKLAPYPTNREPVDLVCRLGQAGNALTETWTYHWMPFPLSPNREVVDPRLHQMAAESRRPEAQ